MNATAAQSDMTSVMEEIRASRAELRQLTNRMDRMSLNAVGGRSPSPEVRRVTFSDQSARPQSPSAGANRGTRQFRRGQPVNRPVYIHLSERALSPLLSKRVQNRESTTSQFRIYSIDCYFHNDRSSTLSHTAHIAVSLPPATSNHSNARTSTNQHSPDRSELPISIQTHQHNRHTDVAVDNFYTINTTEHTQVTGTTLAPT